MQLPDMRASALTPRTVELACQMRAHETNASVGAMGFLTFAAAAIVTVMDTTGRHPHYRWTFFTVTFELLFIALTVFSVAVMVRHVRLYRTRLVEWNTIVSTGHQVRRPDLLVHGDG